MNEYIEVGQPLQFTDPNTPTRVGEIVENVSDIYNIPSPRLGMQVFVKSEKKSFVITSLKSKVIGGVDVPEAAVEAFEPIGAKSFTWNNDTDPSNMNDFVVAGVYDIKGEHTRIDDNLPITNTGGGHSFNARLTVLDSSIPGNGKNDDKCITQVLSFSNRLGQGEVYVRTGKGASLDNLTWEKWSTLQRNVNVDTVTSLDHLIDNGIYSGAYVGTGNKFTFVMVVINDYALAAKLGADRVVNQFLYAVEVGGVVRYTTRQKIGGAPWKSEEILNKDEITSIISAEIKKVTDGIDPEKIDSIKDIVTWIDAHGADAAAMLLEIQQNTVKINAEISRAQAKEKELSDAINSNSEAIGLNFEDINHEVKRATQAENDIKANAMQYNTLGVATHADKAEIYGSSINTDVRVVEFPAATTEKAGVMTAEDKKEQVKITPLVNGDIIVGQAREIHSRNGKTVTDSFLARTTAGSGTIGDGVATLKSVGGNIVKNLVDGTFESGWGTNKGTISTQNGIVTLTPKEKYARIAVAKNNNYPKNVYYQRCAIRCTVAPNEKEVFLGVINSAGSGLSTAIAAAKTTTEWHYLSFIFDGEIKSSLYNNCSIMDKRDTPSDINATKCLFVNLTEMFGAGNEPSKEECDKLFGTMDALPQGLTIANPTEFKSTGYNQADPNKVLADKGIENGAIVDKVGSNIAVVPCLPCKIGVGENNGYCIHGAFDEGAEKVYLTPLNPMEVDGELYMHELTKDADKGTYVPQIKGYMLVEVTTTANLCAHFLWSEDKCERDTYEPYYESVVELPTIPQMSEWGLAGIQTSGTLVCDEIDFERGVYVKRIGSVDLGSLTWRVNNLGDRFVSNVIPGLNDKGNDKINNIINELYSNRKSTDADSPVLKGGNKLIFVEAYRGNCIVVADSAYTDAAAFKAAMQGVMLYYELAEPEEYPLPKVANNYTSSDYGVEQFLGSAVPCNANNLYYMRSLAGETRNFLDRLMAGLGTSDATVVADRILAVVNPAAEPANVEPETPIEP